MRIRLLMSLLIALMPLNVLRLALYRALLGYEIGPGCRIGMLNLIACKHFSLGHSARIGRANVFRGSFEFSAGSNLFIGDFNVFSCPKALDHPKLAGRRYATRIEFGEDCLVNDGHYLDAHGRITVGDGTWIAGRASQFFTHGVGVRDRDIAIGKGCFIGSAARFAPGIRHRRPEPRRHRLGGGRPDRRRRVADLRLPREGNPEHLQTTSPAENTSSARTIGSSDERRCPRARLGGTAGPEATCGASF